MNITEFTTATPNIEDLKNELFNAITNRSLGRVTELIEKNKSFVNATDSNGSTPLSLAVENGMVEIVELLISNGADVNATIIYNNTLLHLATYNDELYIAQLLIEKGVNVNSVENYNNTPLHIATDRGNLDMVGLFIDKGVNVSATNDYGDTPLHWAARSGCSGDIVRRLLDNGASIDPTNKDTRTPLHLAAKRGRFNVAHVLIEKGANINAIDISNNTPLHLAVQYGKFDVALMLINNGSDVNAIDNGGNTPAHCFVKYYALKKQHRSSATMIDLSLARLLEQKGGIFILPNKKGKTPLNLAKESGSVQLIKIFSSYQLEEHTSRNASGGLSMNGSQIESTTNKPPLQVADLSVKAQMGGVNVTHGALSSYSYNREHVTPLVWLLLAIVGLFSTFLLAGFVSVRRHKGYKSNPASIPSNSIREEELDRLHKSVEEGIEKVTVKYGLPNTELDDVSTERANVQRHR